MDIQTFVFSQDAKERISALSIEIANAEARLQQFVDGVVIGMNIDVRNSDISVDLRAMTVRVGPKGGGFPLAVPEEKQD